MTSNNIPINGLSPAGSHKGRPQLADPVHKRFLSRSETHTDTNGQAYIDSDSSLYPQESIHVGTFPHADATQTACTAQIWPFFLSFFISSHIKHAIPKLK